MLEQPTAEAKKAEGPSRAVLLVPSLPSPTGRDAWVAWVQAQLSPEMSMFTIPLKRDLRSWLKFWRTEA